MQLICTNEGMLAELKNIGLILCKLPFFRLNDIPDLALKDF
jgi:hypothetical protein